MKTPGRPPIVDEFSDIPDRKLRWIKRHPEKAKLANRQAQKRYYARKHGQVD